MSIRRKLFASVAAPVLTLPLLLQPAYALPSGLDLAPVQSAAPGIIRVQQEIIPEEGGERPKRRERQENAEQPEGERPQRREQRAQEDGGNEKPQRRQQQDAEQQQERPRREREKAEEQGGERPRQRERQADQGEGNERPQRRQQQDAEQQQERPRREREKAEESKPREEPRQRNAEKPDSERPRQREQKAEQGEGKERPKPSREQNADQAKEPTQRQAQDPKPKDEPRQKSAEQPDSERPRQREQQAEKPKEGERSREREQRAEQDKRDQPPKRGEQAQDGQQRPERATSGGERNQQRAVRQSDEQPRLPVENGAAVLDSAKEQRPDRPRRDGDRPRRDTNRADNQQAEERAAPPPRNDADAQANDRVTRQQREQWRERRRELTEERGERLDRRPDFERPRGWDERGPARGGDRDRDDGRTIISIDNQTFVRHNDSRRFYEDGRQPQYERLGDGRFREVVERSDGTRVVTIRNRYGEVVQRSRVVRGGEEYVLYYAPELLEDRRDYTWRDPGDDLPPMRLGVPVEDYIIDTSSEPDRDYYEFLEQPPVERVERPYSLDEVRYSARIRDKVPRIDLDTITFATGSSEIPMNQASSLRKVADAINKVLEKDPSETFLIEGHTDAVGSDDSNLVLSDRRAESVAVVLSDAFNIPPENLTTQGYGEQYLKVNTDSANQENRRVTIRRITPLVKPVASNQ